MERDEGRERVAGIRLGRRTRLDLIAGAGLAWCAALSLWAQRGLDETLVRMAAGLDPSAPVVAWAEAASRFGMPAIAAIHLVGLATTLRAGGRERRRLYLVVLLSFGIAGVAGDLLKLAVARPRPDLLFPELRFAAGPLGSAAFPSGHATKSLALALPLVLLAKGRRGWQGAAKGAVTLLALAVCASRVVLGVHFPSDVVGGLAVALSGLPFAVRASSYILGQMTLRDLDRAGRIWLGAYALLVLVLSALS